MNNLFFYDKYFFSILLFFFLIFPVYRFLFILTARKYDKKQFSEIEKKLKKKSFRRAVAITFFFTIIYSFNFSKE